MREQFLAERVEYFKEVQRLLYVESCNEESASKQMLVRALCKCDPELGEKQVCSKIQTDEGLLMQLMRSLKSLESKTEAKPLSGPHFVAENSGLVKQIRCQMAEVDMSGFQGHA